MTPSGEPPDGIREIQQLAALVTHRWEAIEADFQRYYAIDLQDVWTGGLGMRRLRALLHGLPAEAAWRRLDPQRPDWTTADYLLARQVEATERLAWITEIHKTAKEKRGQVKPPTPIPRPGIDRPKRAQTTSASKGDWKSKLAGKVQRVDG